MGAGLLHTSENLCLFRHKLATLLHSTLGARPAEAIVLVHNNGGTLASLSSLWLAPLLPGMDGPSSLGRLWRDSNECCTISNGNRVSKAVLTAQGKPAWRVFARRGVDGVGVASFITAHLDLLDLTLPEIPLLRVVCKAPVHLLVVAEAPALHLAAVTIIDANKLAVVMSETAQMVLVVMANPDATLVQLACGVRARLADLALAIVMCALVFHLPLALGTDSVLLALSVMVPAGRLGLKLPCLALPVVLADTVTG